MRKTELYKILFLIIFWVCSVIFIVLYDGSVLGFKSEIEGGDYSLFHSLIVSVIICIIGASLLGSLEVLYLSKVLRKKPFGVALLIKTSVYIVFMLFFISLGEIYLSSEEINKPLFSAEVFDIYVNALFNARILMQVVFWGIACMLALFILQVSEKFGKGVLLNFILGKYHQPKEEERIFIFLDLTSATTIAEKLGAHKYSSFLKDFFFDIDDAIYETQGAVFQFVGDEVVIIWDVMKGITDNNCIRFFFLAEEIIKNKKNHYLTKYGVFPEFKAGLHYGNVIITEVGGSKSEIAYHGDTINTAARVRSVCNEYSKKFLVSAELINHFPRLGDQFSVNSQGVVQLNGKENEIELFSVEKHTGN